MSAHLSKDLRTKHKARSMPISKDDEVIIIRGIADNNSKNKANSKEAKEKLPECLERNGKLWSKKSKKPK
jgi:hypothetical protein